MRDDCKMGRENIYFEERKRAAEYNEILCSREGASELLSMSVSNLSSIELGKHKSVPPDVVRRMAEVYNSPRLVNHYCLNECPLGGNRCNTLSCDVTSLEMIAVHLVKELRCKDVENYLNLMIDVVQDGEITKDEIELCEVLERYFDRVTKIFSEFKIQLSMARKAVAA